MSIPIPITNTIQIPTPKYKYNQVNTLNKEILLRNGVFSSKHLTRCRLPVSCRTPPRAPTPFGDASPSAWAPIYFSGPPETIISHLSELNKLLRVIDAITLTAARVGCNVVLSFYLNPVGRTHTGVLA
ncbi:hypothetical protein EVAR_36983_1 [Eumeta japonica]|uniref:Uncharacterized protein n=1 Tax=Eumeta variegata TaxID=151549 RepID=A0A4C1X2Z7_EUMVA|nr:hypothetical protein EVAR_36983_1 [Eumeta japonica]